jgi:hypothetical protein
MRRFKPPWKTLRKASGWIAVMMVCVLAVQLGLLAFPQVALGNEAGSGSVVVHYDGDPDTNIEIWVGEVDARLRAGGFGNLEDPAKIFLFRNQRLYTFFARLARVRPETQGFGLSVFGTTYVSETRVLALGERTGRAPRYSVWEGSIPHTMAHEVAHLFMADSIGRKAWRGLPHWKQEGFPEYVANIGLVREDPEASLPARIGILLDDMQWLGPRSWDRIHYEAGLLVEYLLEVEGLEFRAALADSITREATYTSMIDWWSDDG